MSRSGALTSTNSTGLCWATVSFAPTVPGVLPLGTVDGERRFGRSMAWTADTVAVSHGDGLALLSTRTHEFTSVIGFEVGEIVCLDFASGH